MLNENMVQLLPNATSLIESMRSIGYSFETAIADVIDNSISAKASEVEIYLLKKNGLPFIQILDDGWGMDNEELLEAMRLGSKNPATKREEGDLGRFGLGLKSASFSQCRVLSVISKKKNDTYGYQWNLDKVAQSNKFEVLRLTDEQIVSMENIEYLADRDSGTIVQWEHFDRITDASTNLQTELTVLMDGATDHLSLIYHRYLDDGLKISVNNGTIKPKDPFLLHHPGTQIRPQKNIEIDGVKIRLQPYVIPYHSNLTAEDKRKLGKANDHYQSQGFYLYRNKRLIVWGDYLGLARKSELAKNLRIQVDIPNSLDYLWEIDVKKSRASIPGKIKKNLLSTITDGEAVSKRIYNFRGNKEVSHEQSIWEFIEEREGHFRFEVNSKNSVYQELLDTMDVDQKKIFSIFIDALCENLPVKKIYAVLADGRVHSLPEKSKVIENLKGIIDFADSQPEIDKNRFCRSLIVMEPFCSDEDAIKLLNNHILGRNDYE